ncbi:P27 family phage terminase small subunit [Ochrobactrum daejeonense]|nr:P27 family phage terminase small subunit [Brucella daejeonensis]
MDVIEGTGSIVVEPDWESLFSDVLEIEAAKEHWRVITTELRDRQLLAPANAHSIQRLVCAYIMFDRMYRAVAEHGVVLKAKRAARAASTA